jgi:DNA-binding protein HU-beta
VAENLSKAELVDVVAKTADITKVAAAAAINCAIETIAAHVNKGGKVTLVGFGTFSQKSRKARTGRNPQTGEPIKIAASKSMSFKASKAAKAAKAKAKAKPAAKGAKKK